MTAFSGPRTVAVEGGELAVWHAGAPVGSGAPVVIALHGITGNHVAWAPVVAPLDDDVTVLAPDQRGRGRSNHLPGPYDLDALARDAVAIIDHAGAETVTVAGHSMGAWVAATVAVQVPAGVSSVVLVDGGLGSAFTPGEVDVQAALRAVLGPALARLEMTFPTIDDYIAFWRAHPAFAGDEIDDDVLLAFAAHDWVDQRSSVSGEAVTDVSRHMLTDEAAATIGDRIEQPAVIVRAPLGLLADDNPLIPRDRADAWVAAAPGRRELVEVSGANHYSITFGRRHSAPVSDAIQRYVSRQ